MLTDIGAIFRTSPVPGVDLAAYGPALSRGVRERSGEPAVMDFSFEVSPKPG